MGEDWVCRCANAFRSIGESGDDARTGEEESGDETTGRWSQEPENMGEGAKDSMFFAVWFSELCCIEFRCSISRKYRGEKLGWWEGIVWQ
jgi:hypothetical protein